VANLKRKDQASSAMSAAMASETRAAVQESVLGFSRETNEYRADRVVQIPHFLEQTPCNA
jgi:predicted Zn-dependent protease